MIHRLAELGVMEPIDVSPILGPFEVLAERYVDRFFSPQGDLLASSSSTQDALWTRYFYQVLIPFLVSNDEVVISGSNVLADDAREVVRLASCRWADS